MNIKFGTQTIWQQLKHHNWHKSTFLLHVKFNQWNTVGGFLKDTGIWTSYEIFLHDLNNMHLILVKNNMTKK